MKPSQATRERDCYQRQISLLVGYLTGSIARLNNTKRKHQAESSACDMAIGELQTILDEVVPAMKDVKP